MCRYRKRRRAGRRVAAALWSAISFLVVDTDRDAEPIEHADADAEPIEHADADA